MAFESTDPTSPHWSEKNFPTEEEIAELPDYIHPATRWALAVIALVAGCVASASAVMRIVGGELAGPEQQQVGGGLTDASAWMGLISGLCWMMAGITLSRGRIVGTGIWFLLGVVTGIVMSLL